MNFLFKKRKSELQNGFDVEIVMYTHIHYTYVCMQIYPKLSFPLEQELQLSVTLGVLATKLLSHLEPPLQP